MPDILSQVLEIQGLGWLLLAVVVAGIVRGFSGFGAAMIIMPVAGTVLGPVGALTFLTMAELLGPLPNIPGALRNANRGDLVRLSLGAAIAMPLGVLALSHMSPIFFNWLVSLVVLGVLAALMRGWRYHGTLTPPLVAGAGALSGVLGGPVIMFYMASSLSIAAIRANLLLFLTFIDLLLIATLAAYGLMETGPVVAGLVFSVPYMVANLLGGRLFGLGSERQFRAVAYGIIATSAILGLPVWH